MTRAFDYLGGPRIVRVGLQIADNDFLQFEGLDIRVNGTKSWDSTMDACEVKISNLTRAQRNFILSKATPVWTEKRTVLTPIIMTVDVGRELKGVFRLFQGSVYTSTVTPPPDIGIVLRSLTMQWANGVIIPFSLGGLTPLSKISQLIAQQLGLGLEFHVKNDRNIANFSFTGGMGKLVQKLQLVGDVQAYVSGSSLVVQDKDSFRGPDNFTLSMQSGMVGIPQANESGATAQMLVDPAIKVGMKVTIDSQINPSVNGPYALARLGFDITSRDDPFWYNLTCSNRTLNQGTQP